MSVCNPQGKVFEFAKFAPGSAIRFASVSECPVVTSAMKLYVKRAPQGGGLQPSDPPYNWAFYNTDKYKELRFAMQSFPSK